jgi:hypothetical protein
MATRCGAGHRVRCDARWREVFSLDGPRPARTHTPLSALGNIYISGHRRRRRRPVCALTQDPIAIASIPRARRGAETVVPADRYQPVKPGLLQIALVSTRSAPALCATRAMSVW